MKAICTVLFCFSFLLLCFGCEHKQDRKYRIALVSFGKINNETRKLSENTCRNLLNDSIHQVEVTWIRDTIPMQPAYHAPRNRYRAEIVLKELKGLADHHTQKFDTWLLVTDLPISTTAHGIHDYGICGLSYRKSGVSIVSAHGLNNATFCQVLRHEWGHGTGLPHCEEEDCIMNSANGKIKNVLGHDHFSKKCYAFVAERYW